MTPDETREVVTIDNLEFLVAAYSAVWIILAIYLFVLLYRNRKLLQALATLEKRLHHLESKADKQEPQQQG